MVHKAAPSHELRHEFRRHKELAERAMLQLKDKECFERPAAQVNPVALIVTTPGLSRTSRGRVAIA